MELSPLTILYTAVNLTMAKVLIAPTTLAGLQTGFVDVLKKAGFELVYHGIPRQLNEEQLLSARWTASTPRWPAPSRTPPAYWRPIPD